MLVLVSQEWNNTANNHAGISFMCDRMVSLYPTHFKHVKIPFVSTHQFFPKIFKSFSSKVNEYVRRFIQNRKILSSIGILRNSIEKGDSLYLMEYFDTSLDYLTIASQIRQVFPQITIYAHSHLVPEKLQVMFDDNKLVKWKKPVDKIVTFGSSLSDYYIRRGINRNDVITTFDPVDEYYLNDELCLNSTFSVLVMGNQMRDEEMLRQVVEANSDILFRICQGTKDYSSFFKTSNVELIPFVPEEVLRNYMKTTDVSLNIFKDVIGSTVISTSLGMGMAMVCTDVGSIRDYCDDSNTLFCKSLDDYCKALNILKNDKKLLQEMKNNSRHISNNLTTDVFCQLLISTFKL